MRNKRFGEREENTAPQAEDEVLCQDINVVSLFLSRESRSVHICYLA